MPKNSKRQQILFSQTAENSQISHFAIKS